MAFSLAGTESITEPRMPKGRDHQITRSAWVDCCTLPWPSQWTRVVTDSHAVPCLTLHCPPELPLRLSLPPVFIPLVFLITTLSWVSGSASASSGSLLEMQSQVSTPTSRMRTVAVGPVICVVTHPAGASDVSLGLTPAVCSLSPPFFSLLYFLPLTLLLLPGNSSPSGTKTF